MVGDRQDSHGGDPSETGQAPVQWVEIDMDPLVGKGGGESSVRTEAQQGHIEDR